MGKKSNRKKLNEFIKSYAKDLELKIPLEKVILFGSYARGAEREESDVDLVFVSSAFSGMDSMARFKLIGSVRKNYSFAVDYFGFTHEELESASSLTTLGEIRETGKALFINKSLASV